MSSTSIRERLTAHRWTLVGGAVAVAMVIWLLWPAVDAGGDVVLVGDAAAAATFPGIVTQVRDNGRQATVGATVADGCDVADAVGGLAVGPDVEFVVIAVSDPSACPDVVDRAAVAAQQLGLQPVVVQFPGVDAGDSRAAIIIDTGALLGAPGTERMPCEWWDRVDPFLSDGPLACSAADEVVVRADDGSLTDAGIDRIARMVAAGIG